MAGGKETPRQKMIGMMYLVLTALLALNVSKQVIAAFITLNDKLDASAEVMEHKIGGTYAGFDKRRATLKLNDGNTELIDLWEGKAGELKDETDLMVDFLLRECNDMIVEADGEDWIAEEKEIETKDGKVKVVKRLKPLFEINSFDNYDIPTSMFVGGDPNNPNERGLEIPKKIGEFRDRVCTLMGTYKENSTYWEFIAPKDPEGLDAALETCNPEDTAKIRQVYETLSYPEKLIMHGEGEMPWPSVMFDHAPIVAAAAMFTSMKLDIKNAESTIAEYMLAKVDVPPFNFNKIEPLAFAHSSYMNAGDSMDLNVMIAAYDSNDVAKIRYGIDADTANPDNWKEVTGGIPLYADSPGSHKVRGVIGVKERNETTWKDFDFNYNVGKPMGVIAQPEMRVLYWGYDNQLEGTASGFDPNKVGLSPSSGVTLRRSGDGKYIAKVERGVRNATIGVTATRDDGSKVNLGSFSYVCRPFPAANVYVAGRKSGEDVPYQALRDMNKITMAIDPSSPITTATYTILGGEVYVNGQPGVGMINRGGSLDGTAKKMLGQSRGKKIMIEIRYKGPGGSTRIANYSGKVI